MSSRCFNQASLADAFVKACCRAGAILEEFAKTFDWPTIDLIMGGLDEN